MLSASHQLLLWLRVDQLMPQKPLWNDVSCGRQRNVKALPQAEYRCLHVISCLVHAACRRAHDVSLVWLDLSAQRKSDNETRQTAVKQALVRRTNVFMCMHFEFRHFIQITCHWLSTFRLTLTQSIYDQFAPSCERLSLRLSTEGIYFVYGWGKPCDWYQHLE